MVLDPVEPSTVFGLVRKCPDNVGGDFRTMKGLQILRINYTYNVLYVLGQSIPGEPGEMVKLFDSRASMK